VTSASFDLTTDSARTFKVNFTTGGATTVAAVDLSTAFTTDAARLTATTEQVVDAIQTQLDATLGAGEVTAVL
jgi:hypothetical protein